MEEHVGVYPEPMISNPAIWGTDYNSFLYPIFAVYFEKQNRFGIYHVRVANEYHIIKPYKTERTDPFYFHATGSPANHPLEVYSVKAQFSFCIWFQQGWLCKKNGTRMAPIFPVMKLTNTPTNCKYSKYFSTTVYKSPIALEWIDRYKSIDKLQIRLAIQIALPIPYAPVFSKAIIPTIPAFVTSLLVEDAIKKKQDCPITMEPITKELARVTSCYHVFDRDAITTWLIAHTTCPVCKQTCKV